MEDAAAGVSVTFSFTDELLSEELLLRPKSEDKIKSYPEEEFSSPPPLTSLEFCSAARASSKPDNNDSLLLSSSPLDAPLDIGDSG